jgi:hypothetical protein
MLHSHRRFRTLLLAAVVALATPAVSHAVPITTLFNTGVGATGVPLANNASDAHYKYTSVPTGGPTALRVETSANGYPAPYWFADNTLSAWIGPQTNASLDGPQGNYTYETTFDLTGFQASTASITGKWVVDNTGVDIRLNGVSAGKTANSYATFSAFTLANSFISGLNKLDFIVLNTEGPSGLRVEMTGTVSPNAVPVPEPISMAVLGSGLLTLGLLRRKRG